MAERILVTQALDERDSLVTKINSKKAEVSYNQIMDPLVYPKRFL